MNGDWFDILGGVADALGVGDEAKRGLGGLGAYLRGQSTETSDDDADEAPYVYERVLTRPRDPRANDR